MANVTPSNQQNVQLPKVFGQYKDNFEKQVKSDFEKYLSAKIEEQEQKQQIQNNQNQNTPQKAKFRIKKSQNQSFLAQKQQQQLNNSKENKLNMSNNQQRSNKLQNSINASMNQKQQQDFSPTEIAKLYENELQEQKIQKEKNTIWILDNMSSINNDNASKLNYMNNPEYKYQQLEYNKNMHYSPKQNNNGQDYIPQQQNSTINLSKPFESKHEELLNKYRTVWQTSGVHLKSSNLKQQNSLKNLMGSNNTLSQRRPSSHRQTNFDLSQRKHIGRINSSNQSKRNSMHNLNNTNINNSDNKKFMNSSNGQKDKFYLNGCTSNYDSLKSLINKNKDQDLTRNNSNRSINSKNQQNYEITQLDSIKQKLNSYSVKNNKPPIPQSINKSKNISSRQDLHLLNTSNSKSRTLQRSDSKQQINQKNQNEFQPIFDHIDYKTPFPEWLSNRKDFQELSNQEYYNIDKKILSIAKIPSFNRTGNEKQLITLFLQKLSLFNLMPESLLDYVAGKLTTQSFTGEKGERIYRPYKNGEYVCRKGDKGNCMYIIFRGVIEVVVKDKVVATFKNREFLGRSALETDEPRNADLRARGEVDLLILERTDYQHCLFQFIKLERQNIDKFVSSIEFLNFNFKPIVIQRLLKEIKIRFLAAKDKLYQTGDKIDGIYIVRSGLLQQKVKININYFNQWPITKEGKTVWERRQMSKVFDYTIEYKEGHILGYQEIVDPNPGHLRIDTINAAVDTVVIFLPKAQFTWIFPEADYKIFKEYNKTFNPNSVDQLQEKILESEQEAKIQFNQFKLAMQQNLSTYNQNKFNSKQKRTSEIINLTKKKIQDNLKQQIPSTSTKAQVVISDIQDEFQTQLQ